MNEWQDRPTHRSVARQMDKTTVLTVLHCDAVVSYFLMVG